MKTRTKAAMTAIFFLLFALVAGNFFRISVIQNKKFQDMANDQHFGAITIPAHRGTIYDANNATLAKSATVYRVFLDPQLFRTEMEDLQKRIDKREADSKKGIDPVKNEDGTVKYPLPESVGKFKSDAKKLLSEQLGITEQDVEDAMNDEYQYAVLQSQVEKQAADTVLEFFNQYLLTSLDVEEDTKRYYPQNELAASVIGFTSSNGGVYGLEAYYDDYLAGVDGRTVSAKDSNGNELPYRYSKTYAAKNGDDLYLTLDMNIQHYLEKHLQEMTEQYEVANRSCAILMNAKTGAIYGMATYPGFDPNDPYEIHDQRVAAEIENMSEELQKVRKSQEQEYQWKNKCITEVYEPGSVFKVITSSAAFEERLIDLTNDSFFCSGSVTLDGAAPINCHKLPPGHGAQTFQQALTNSCNPAFMNIGFRLGTEKFSYYFDAFGLRERTGIDLPAESVGIGHDSSSMSEVDLAVDSFGQGETITPIEMITSYAAAINGGYLLQPYVVDRIVDKDGNVVLKNERTVRRQVVSSDTSDTIRSCLEQVVVGNSGGNVTIKGYSIGGKSGTSERLSLSPGPDDSFYGASYVCFTPADDPELILLVLADLPNADIGYYGSIVAVPTARDILTDVLPYMGYSPEYSEEELANLDVTVPFLEGSLEAAKTTLEGLGLNAVPIGSGSNVTAQSPVTGTVTAKGSTVYLYTDSGTDSETTEVPNFVTMTPEQVNDALVMYDLNYVSKGAPVTRQNAVVNSQSIAPGTPVPVGTVVELEFIVYADQD
ncbi:MAG: PASTA domain-containing protein [Ruminococcus sp.]|nr:PASTA domain-containing protein [Ruminococcus sp.]